MLSKLKDAVTLAVAGAGAFSTTEVSIRILIGVATFFFMSFRALREFDKWRSAKQRACAYCKKLHTHASEYCSYTCKQNDKAQMRLV